MYDANFSISLILCTTQTDGDKFRKHMSQEGTAVAYSFHKHNKYEIYKGQ